MQALRTAHQAEVKRIEKEKERMADRWNKLADAQVKLSATPAGVRCANAVVVDAADVQLRGKGQGFLEVALEQAEAARKDLSDQNRRLRGLILSTANEMQRVVHGARVAESAEDIPEVRGLHGRGLAGDVLTLSQPAPLTLSTLFPLAPTEAAGEKLSVLMGSIRESLAHLSKSTNGHGPEPLTSSRNAGSIPGGQKAAAADSAAVDRLQAVIDKLRAELGVYMRI